MNTKDTHINDSNFQKLLHNDNYYRHIFKKTEKIISVVFYILNNIDHDKKSETHTSNLASKAHFAHENALRSLEVKPLNATEVLEQFAQALVGLDSTLRIAGTSGVMTNEVVYVVTTEIDAVLRGLSQYITNDTGVSAAFTQSSNTTQSKMVSTDHAPFSSNAKPTQKRAPASTKEQQGADRRTRIQTILEAKGEATIKDISEIITDCSEKTVQRELNAMIEDSIVKRQGERRWSKYSLT